MRKFLALLILTSCSAFAQFTTTAKHITQGSALPSTCSPLSGDIFFIKSGGGLGPYYCSATNTWSAITGSSVGNAFSVLTGGTNTAAAMVVGNGSSLSFTGTGTNNANLYKGNATVAIADGGTAGTTQTAAFDNLAPTATVAGSIIYWNGTHWVKLDGNSSGTNFLQENASGVPSWAAAGGGTPCTGTALSLQFNNAGAFGCLAEFTYASSTITSSASGIVNLASGKLVLPTTNTAGPGILISTVSDTSQISFDSSVLAGVYPTIAGPNTFTAGGKNTVSSSVTTAGFRIGAAANPLSPVSGDFNIDLSGRFNIYGSAGWGALQIADNKTFLVNNTLTFTGTDSSSVAFGAGGTAIKLIASGAKVLATGAISSGACTAAQTDTATGAATSDSGSYTFAADPTAVTGYTPSANGMLTIIPYITSNTMNFKVCNNTSASITPGAVTINWLVTRSM